MQALFISSLIFSEFSFVGCFCSSALLIWCSPDSASASGSRSAVTGFAIF